MHWTLPSRSDPGNERIALYMLPEAQSLPGHLEPAPDAAFVFDRIGSMSEAHNPPGRVHKGTWTFVVDASQRILMLKRGPHLKTCPNAWGVLGEHSTPNESYEQAALRGISEELGLGTKDVSRSHNLTSFPVMFHHDYRLEGGSKLDMQAT